jgi:hypothetical protein
VTLFLHHTEIDMKIQFVYQINIFMASLHKGGEPGGTSPPGALGEDDSPSFWKRTFHERRRGRSVGLFPQKSGYVQLVITQLIT